jgi:hypothetical protein
MCNLTDNFMEDHIFYLRLKQEHEYRMWSEYVEQKEAEEKAYDKMAEDHFKSLEEFEKQLQTN